MILLSNTLTINQIQAIVIGVTMMLTAIIPLVTGVAILAVRNYGEIKQAWATINQHDKTINGASNVIAQVEQMARSGGSLPKSESGDSYAGQ